MKKFFLMAAAVFAFAACTDKNNTDPTPKEDSISVSPESKSFDGDGGSASVIVTSTGDWTMASKDGAVYNWVAASSTSGVDGDIVTFTVDANKDALKTADFVFTCGKAEASFTVTSVPGDLPEVNVTSETSIVTDFTAGNFDVLLSISEGINYRELKATVSEGADWLTHAATLDGDEDNTAKMAFNYTKNEGLEARDAEITISYAGAEPAVVSFKQMPQPKLQPAQPAYKLGADAGTLEIAVSANVEYEITYGEGSDWLTGHKTEGNVEKWSYGALAEGGKREATIIFTEKNPAGGAEALTATVVVKQSNAIISTVAYMKKHSAGASEWKNPDVLKLGTTFTVECLVRHDENFTAATGWDGAQIGTLFGLERRLLVRHGDDRYNVKKWELVYARNTKESNGENMEVKLASSKELPGGEWVHIAVVFDGTAQTVTIYQDGEQVGTEAMHSDIKDVDLTETYNGNNTTQKFYLGRSYNSSRDFEGMMSEVRIWNKALTSDEINAANHFYMVPADSDGLVAYWKLNDGQGYIIKDYTSNGNDLTGESYSGSSWSAGMEWRDVDLP